MHWWRCGHNHTWRHSHWLLVQCRYLYLSFLQRSQTILSPPIRKFLVWQRICRHRAYFNRFPHPKNKRNQNKVLTRSNHSHQFLWQSPSSTINSLDWKGLIVIHPWIYNHWRSKSYLLKFTPPATKIWLVRIRFEKQSL